MQNKEEIANLFERLEVLLEFTKEGLDSPYSLGCTESRHRFYVMLDTIHDMVKKTAELTLR